MRLLPQFKGYDFFPHDLRLPFMRYKGICLALSTLESRSTVFCSSSWACHSRVTSPAASPARRQAFRTPTRHWERTPTPSIPSWPSS